MYVIKNAILVTLSTYDKFIEDVYNIEYLGNDRRQSPSFYLDIQRFLQHLICNNFLYSKDSLDEKWTKYSPLPSELGKDELRFVFEQAKNLCCTRALELLSDAGIIKIKSHSFEKQKCRRFALSKEYLSRWFCIPVPEYKKRKDRYIYLSTGKRQRGGKIITEEELIQQALSHFDKPRHTTWQKTRETHDYLKSVYSSMGGLRINLDKLQEYNPRNEREVLQKSHFLHHLADRGCRMISSVPLIVEYFPEYKLADNGSRSFEQNGGFQALKSTIKWNVFEGYNYDIKSSQLTILRHELERYGINCNLLNKITKKKVMKRFQIDEKTAKLFIYSLIYSLGEFRKHRESKAFDSLCKLYGYDVAVKKANKWRVFVEPIKIALNKLVSYYISEGVYCPGRGWAIRNAVRQTYMIESKEVTGAIKRKVLSHMIQGIESKAIYETILNNPGLCCSIEHDGLVSNEPIIWAHPYLRIVQKHCSLQPF